jgi:hypothetical protein
MKRNSFFGGVLVICLALAMTVVGCDNGTSPDDDNIVVTIKGIPREYIGLDSEISVNPTSDTLVGLDVFRGPVSGTTMTVSYEPTQKDITTMKNLGIVYDPNGSYWVEFDIEEYLYADFVTKEAVKFKGGKVTVNFSEFKED